MPEQSITMTPKQDGAYSFKEKTGSQSTLLKKGQEILYAGNYKNYISYLYQLGTELEKKFKHLHLSTYFKSGDRGKRRAFWEHVRAAMFFNTDAMDTESTAEHLFKRAQHLEVFFSAWGDDELSRQKGSEKEQRQRVKFKAELDKTHRRVIHMALGAQVFGLLSELSYLYTQQNNNKIGSEYVAILERDLEQAINSESALGNKKLIDIVSRMVNLLETHCASDIKQATEVIREKTEKGILEAGKAIRSFEKPIAKFIRLSTKLLALMIGVICGLTTAISVVGLFAVASPAVLALATLIFLTGFLANYGFFSKALPQFFLKLFKSGSIFEFIDEEGNRKQLSRPTKFLLVIFALMSCFVGLTAGAFVFSALVATFACPPVAAILLGATLCIGLSVIMFSAFVGIAPKLSWNTLKEAWGSFCKDLTMKKALKRVATGLLGVLALIGLGFLCVTGLPGLAGLFGGSVVAALVISALSFLAQIPFTLIAVTNLFFLPVIYQSIKNHIRMVFRPNEAEQEIRWHVRLGKGLWGIAKEVVGLLQLALNAGGNALTVYGNPPATFPVPKALLSVATAGAGLNSFAGNLVIDDSAAVASVRNEANEKMLKSILGRKNEHTVSSDVPVDVKMDAIPLESSTSPTVPIDLPMGRKPSIEMPKLSSSPATLFGSKTAERSQVPVEKCSNIPAAPVLAMR